MPVEQRCSIINNSQNYYILLSDTGQIKQILFVESIIISLKFPITEILVTGKMTLIMKNLDTHTKINLSQQLDILIHTNTRTHARQNK